MRAAHTTAPFCSNQFHTSAPQDYFLMEVALNLGQNINPSST